MKILYYPTIKTIVVKEDRAIAVIEDDKINVWDIKDMLGYDACALLSLYEEWVNAIKSTEE